MAMENYVKTCFLCLVVGCDWKVLGLLQFKFIWKGDAAPTSYATHDGKATVQCARIHGIYQPPLSRQAMYYASQRCQKRRYRNISFHTPHPSKSPLPITSSNSSSQQPPHSSQLPSPNQSSPTTPRETSSSPRSPNPATTHAPTCSPPITPPPTRPRAPSFARGSASDSASCCCRVRNRPRYP